MSLPPVVRWGYGESPALGSAEAHALELLKPRDWV
jgi:coproporphyrinogen III oxidase